MNLKHYLSCLLVIFLFTTVSAQEQKAAKGKEQKETKAEAPKELKAGDESPSFKYLDINGKEVSLADLKGNYVYIDVWATWCGPCVNQLPHLKELEKKMHGKKIVFVSMSCDKDKKAWEKMVKDENLGGIQLHIGDDYSFMNAYAIKGIPRFILLDKKGKIVNPNMTRPSKPETLTTLEALKGI